jgi:two-component system, OmpR family, phosphate regulon sensor histidine kinase PhoR
LNGAGPLRNIISIKTSFAIVLIAGGAWIAAALAGNLERTVVMVVSSLIAVFLIAGGDEKPDAQSKLLDNPNPKQPITQHPDFQGFIEATHDAIIIVENAKVVIANQAALQLLGKAIINQNVRVAFRHAGAIERLSDPNAQHDGRPIPLIGIGMRNQQWELRIQSIGDDQKLVHLSDRTGAQATEKMRVDFVANASHELLTPLASIKGFIETLTETEAGQQKQTRTRFLGIMQDEASRMQALIRDLMSLSRIEAEKYKLSSAPVNMADLITEVVAPLRSGSQSRGQELILTIHDNLRPVLGDVGQLRQLASNIIANAMKYGRSGTPITISLSPTRSQNMLSLTVEDQGEGIAPEHLPRLTERFYRVDPGRSRTVGGTGLGLSLVKHIIDGHRGHLEIKSVVGKGTTITVLLPFEAAADGAQINEKPSLSSN